MPPSAQASHVRHVEHRAAVSALAVLIDDRTVVNRHFPAADELRAVVGVVVVEGGAFQGRFLGVFWVW